MHPIPVRARGVNEKVWCNLSLFQHINDSMDVTKSYSHSWIERVVRSAVPAPQDMYWFFHKSGAVWRHTQFLVEENQSISNIDIRIYRCDANIDICTYIFIWHALASFAYLRFCAFCTHAETYKNIFYVLQSASFPTDFLTVFGIPWRSVSIFERLVNAVSGNFYTVVTQGSPILLLENFNLDITVVEIRFNMGIRIHKSDATSWKICVTIAAFAYLRYCTFCAQSENK